MMDSSPLIHRAQKKRAKKFQEGTVVSFTRLANPPARFGKHPRCIGLVELADHTRILASLISESPQIGQRVLPRMRLSFVNDEGLRVYDVAYEAAAQKTLPEQIEVFPRYILALTGPSGVGKSTVSKLLTKTFSGSLAHVPIVTTRKAKEGDEREYRYVSEKEFSALKKRGEIVAATEIPSASERRWYGYCAADIQVIWEEGKLPVVVTEMHLLHDLSRHFGRRFILSLGLLPPGKSRRAMLSQLLFRMRHRGRETEEQIWDRLQNAEKDLAFFRERKDLFDHIFVNEDLDALMGTLEERLLSFFETVPLPSFEKA